MISGDEMAEYDALESADRLLDTKEMEMPEEAQPKGTKEEAIEMAVMFAMLAASGRKDADDFKQTARSTFLSMLEGFGYEVVAK